MPVGGSPVTPVDKQGNVIGTSASPTVTQSAQTSYTLASNQAVAATSGTAPVLNVLRGNYVWDAQFTGTSIKLQSLGADGVTWRDVATLSASGTFAGEIRFGANAQVRLYNPNATPDTGVYSSLS